jgi:hypothetical protein
MAITSTTPWKTLRALLMMTSLGVGITACAAREQYVEPPHSLHVANQGRVRVADVKWKPCGSPDDAYKSMGRLGILAGSAVELDEFTGCRDLVALDDGGNVLGRQDHLTLMPGSTWTIR